MTSIRELQAGQGEDAQAKAAEQAARQAEERARAEAQAAAQAAAQALAAAQAQAQAQANVQATQTQNVSNQAATSVASVSPPASSSLTAGGTAPDTQASVSPQEKSLAQAIVSAVIQALPPELGSQVSAALSDAGLQAASQGGSASAGQPQASGYPDTDPSYNNSQGNTDGSGSAGAADPSTAQAQSSASSAQPQAVDTQAAAITSSGASSQVQSTSPGTETSGATATRDGYTVDQVKADILKTAADHSDQGAPPTDPILTQLAQGIVDGINNNFSGVNQIGDFSKVSGAEIAKGLVSAAWQESRFGKNGLDAGGIFQSTQGRLDDYNNAHGTHYTQADLQNNVPLAIQTSLFSIANPNGFDAQGNAKPSGIVGKAASSSNPIPSDLVEQALYYWNYNPTSSHGHANELSDYSNNTSANADAL